MTGWGNFGENLLAQLWEGDHTFFPIIVREQPQYRFVPVLSEIYTTQSHIPSHFKAGFGYGEEKVPFTVMHAISGAFEKDVRQQVSNSCLMHYSFFR